MKTIVFVDYWNLQLSIQQEDAKALNIDPIHTHRFQIDWFNLGQIVTQCAQDNVRQTVADFELNFQETRIYTSSNPAAQDGGSYKRWIDNVLNRQAGIRTFCLDRKPKRHQVCPACNAEISHCNHCGAPIQATQEKGVDTLLVTDLLRLGLDYTYEVAIIVSQDSDMKPAVDHLSSKGIKVIHAGIKHYGANLSNSCWAKFDLFPIRHQIQRA